MNVVPGSCHGGGLGSQSVGDGVDIDITEACNGARDPLHDVAGELRVFLPPRRDRRLGTGNPAGPLAQIDGSPAELGASPWHPSVLDEPASPAILAQAADVPPVRDSARVICGCRDHGQGRAPADLEP